MFLLSSNNEEPMRMTFFIKAFPGENNTYKSESETSSSLLQIKVLYFTMESLVLFI